MRRYRACCPCWSSLQTSVCMRTPSSQVLFSCPTQVGQNELDEQIGRSRQLLRCLHSSTVQTSIVSLPTCSTVSVMRAKSGHAA